MPLEIRELYIKVAVNEDNRPQGNTSASGTEQGNRQEEMIQSCVERVLEILKDREER